MTDQQLQALKATVDQLTKHVKVLSSQLNTANAEIVKLKRKLSRVEQTSSQVSHAVNQLSRKV